MTTQSFWDLINRYRIIVPIIQRDYAQGRATDKVREIRERFLDAIVSSLQEGGEMLELDFVYGYTSDKENATFIPLDGQQRLTTLFLLHWLVAAKEGHLNEAQSWLSNFSYEIRHSARLFCKDLVEFNPHVGDFRMPISKVIIDQPWFFTAWQQDPTIKAMLVMLDDLQRALGGREDVWPLLTSASPRIVFHLLPMEQLGLPDDLYIKMNSRGKQLTAFEYFKSRFTEILTLKHAAIFNQKIDQEWSDLFWKLYYSNQNQTRDIAMYVDDGFLRFLRYISDILNFQNNISESHKDDFEYYKSTYSNTKNVEHLFAYLDALYETTKKNPDFFNEIFYIDSQEYSSGKARLFFNDPTIDLLKKCADKYENNPGKVNPFSIGEQLLLFACLQHLVYESIDFNSRIRVFRNLIANSGFEIRRDTMPELLRVVADFILKGDYATLAVFNSRQIAEEQTKWQFKIENHILVDDLHKLEDHILLQGCLSIFNLDTNLNSFGSQFMKVFKSGFNYDDVSCALLTFGDYSQRYRNTNKRFGTSSPYLWNELFTPSAQRGNYDNTKAILKEMLDYLIKNPTINVKTIVEQYLASFKNEPSKPKNWIYYFIKYRQFRTFEDGYYNWPNYENEQYVCIKLRRSQRNGFHWSPFLQVIYEETKQASFLDDYGGPLSVYKDNAILRVHNRNSGFFVESIDNEESRNYLERVRAKGLLDENNVYIIRQNESDLDLEDRIIKGVEFVNSIIEL